MPDPTFNIRAPFEDYRVEIDSSSLTAETLLDNGQRLGDPGIEPIGGCSLTPGHPSPVARDADGCLVYVADSQFLQDNGHVYVFLDVGDLAMIRDALGVIQEDCDDPDNGGHDRDKLLALRDRIERLLFEAGEDA